jgi:hypothetical protein
VTEAEFRAHLQAMVDATCGSAGALARKHGVNPKSLTSFLCCKRGASDELARAFGYQRTFTPTAESAGPDREAVAREAEWETIDGGSLRVGLDISMFVDLDEQKTESRFQMQVEDESEVVDTRPYLKAAIAALQAELADLENCPVHTLSLPSANTHGVTREAIPEGAVPLAFYDASDPARRVATLAEAFERGGGKISVVGWRQLIADLNAALASPIKEKDNG